MSIRTRILSFALSFVLAIGLLPVVSFADESSDASSDAVAVEEHASVDVLANDAQTLADLAASTSQPQMKICSSGTVADIVSVANAQVDGTGESNYVSDFSAWTNTPYSWYSGAWCTVFVAWCARTAGIDESVIPTIASSYHMEDYYRSIGRFHPVDEVLSGTYEPQVGDLILYDWHTSLVIGKSGTTLTLKHGNYGNSEVGTSTMFDYRSASYDSGQGVIGYANPDYPPSAAEIDPDEWYIREGWYDYVMNNGIMTGYDNGEFGAYDSVTRGQTATIIYRAATGNTPESTDNYIDTGFYDAPAGNYYSAAVAWCADRGIVVGYGDGTFRPDSVVSRQELATMIARWIWWQQTGSATIQDSDMTLFNSLNGVEQVHPFARDAMAFCCSKGIIGGVGGTDLNPLDGAWRASVAKMITVSLRDVMGIRG